MMEIKMIEVRDRSTFIPMMAIRLGWEGDDQDQDRYLLRRAGYGGAMLDSPRDGMQYVILVRLTGGEVSATYDPYGWDTRARTIPTAHRHLIDHWSEVKSGDVVDVEFILGEVKKPKISERLTAPF
jgi:hypothetical protein